MFHDRETQFYNWETPKLARSITEKLPILHVFSKLEYFLTRFRFCNILPNAKKLKILSFLQGAVMCASSARAQIPKLAQNP